MGEMSDYHNNICDTLNPYWETLSNYELKQRLEQCRPGDKASIEAEKVADRTGEFIVWNPTSGLPPKVRFETQAEAEGAASDMARRHGEVFYVAQLVARAVKAEPPVELTRLKKKDKR